MYSVEPCTGPQIWEDGGERQYLQTQGRVSRDRLYSLCDVELSLPGRTCAKAFISVLHVMGK